MQKTATLKSIPLLILLCGFSTTALADGQDEPIPSYYEEPGISNTRDYLGQHANERIDPFTGKLQWHYVDLFIPGNGGMDMKVTRSYTSPYVPGLTTPWEPNLTGLGWTMHAGRVLRKSVTLICSNIGGPTTNPVLELPDGSRQVLYLALDGVTWVTTNFWKAECNLTAPGGGLDVLSPDGTRYEMTAKGHAVGTSVNQQSTFYVSKVTDRNGNWISYSYQFINGLQAMTGAVASDGRTLTFVYNGNVLSTITDESNRVWTYIYTAVPNNPTFSFLKEVVRPGGDRWIYAYNETNAGAPGDYAVRKVTYPQGGTIDYTYDFVYFALSADIPRSTVVKTKVASSLATGSLGTWTWTYTPATKRLTANTDGSYSYSIPPTGTVQDGAIDATNVTGPDESRDYFHVGYNSVYPGAVYTMGSLLGTSSAVQVEVYSHAPIQISYQANVRPGNSLAFDSAAYAPLVTAQYIGRFGESFLTTYSNFDSYGNSQTISETGSHTRTNNVIYFTDSTKWIVRGVKKDETLTEGSETLATTRTFDGNANLKSETRAGVATNFLYTAEGDLASRTDARQKTTNYSNYFRGIPRTETQPEGVVFTRAVSSAGNVSSETDGELVTTSFDYDGLSRITGITHPLGNPVTVDWLATTRTVSRGAYREVKTYDGFGREISQENTDTLTGEVITQTYLVDALGRRTYASYPNASKGTGFSYDMLNRLIYVFNEYVPPSPSNLFGSWANSRYHDYFSYLVQVVNEKGFQYLYTYRIYGDPDSRDLIGITDPLSNIENTTITRNIAGQMITIKQDGVTRTYGYDTRFYLTSITEPETGVTTMERDNVGNMTSRKVGTSGLTNYTYDDRNRVTNITYPVGTPAVTKVYYKDDNLKSIDNGVAKREYVYDFNKNLRSETLTVDAKPFLAQYAYNTNDVLSTLTYGSGQVVDYAPDAFGRARKASPYVTVADYHPAGSPKSFTYANGVQSIVGINGRQWPSTLQIVKSGDLFNMTYLYDTVGNVSSITNTVDSAYNRTMTYDNLDRLKTVSGPWGSGTIAHEFRGNITSQNFGTYNLSYVYDTVSQRLQSVSGSKAKTMSYDTYGNVVGNGAMSFAFNDDATMRCAKCGLADEILYDYDGMNQRVRSKTGGASTFFVSGQGGQLLWEETPTIIKEYIYLGGKQVATREQALP